MTDHVRQFPWCLRFPAILRRVRGGEDSEDLADGIRFVAVVVSVLGHNCAMGGDYLFPPCLLFRPFYDGKYNDRSEFAVYPHSIPLQFCSKRCHALNVGDDHLSLIENGSRGVEKPLSYFCGIWYIRPLCDSGEHLMNLVLVNRFEVAVVRRPQDGVGYVFFLKSW